jgi:GT2 family glycosyltransferase
MPQTAELPSALSARPDDAWPSVTVAVLAYNRRDEVRTTLRKVLDELDYPSEALDVIVVDNASTDGTAEMLAEEFPAVQVIRMPDNVGASAWNRAFAVGRGTWFLVLDDDAHLEGDGLKRAVAAAEATDADLVSFRVRSGPRPDYLFNDEYVTGLLAFWGCAWLISRRAIDRLEGYDPYIFMWGNEAELTARLLDEGFRHLFLADVVAVHMKVPRWQAKTYERRGHELNFRHWAYMAGKLLRPLDAARVLGRLLLTVLLDAVALSPRSLRTVPIVLAGFRDGLRHRRPLRPAVSATYRDAFASFVNPLRWLRRPGERLRGGGLDTAERQRRFYAARPDVYPDGTGVLGL